jgi:FecR-like protein
MSRRNTRHALRYLMAGACLALAPAVAAAAPAARVEFTVGSVSATSATGQTRLLVKGADVDSGDTVNTRDGRVQLRFSDGAYVSLQPQTLFRIDDYRYDGKSDGNERGFFSLLKGGLRTITGLVGRSNKRNYQVSTAVATIGIRGTEYTLAYTNSVSGSVGEGQIDVCNGGGCQAISSGQSFFVAGNNVKPEITSKKTDLPPSQPGDVQGGKYQTANDAGKPNGQSSLPSFVSGDTTSENGDLNLFLLTGTRTLSLATAGISGFQSATTVVLDAAGAVTQLDTCGDACIVTFPTGLKGFGNDGTIAWGHGMSQDSSGGLLYAHYVTGLPTPLTDIASLQANRVVATYSLLGGTFPTADSGPGQSPFAAGTVQSAGLTVDFGALTASASVNFKMNGLIFAARADNMFLNGNLFDNANAASSCSVAGGTCTLTYLAGFVAGSQASRAGFVYDVSTTALGPTTACPRACSASLKGAAALVKNP